MVSKHIKKVKEVYVDIYSSDASSETESSTAGAWKFFFCVSGWLI
jgi:hypothetical protein